DMERRSVRPPRLVPVPRILAHLSVVSDQPLVVDPPAVALVPAGRGEVETNPDEGTPKVRLVLQRQPVGFVVARLVLLRVPAAHRLDPVGRRILLVQHAGTRAVFADGEGPRGMFRMEARRPA